MSHLGALSHSFVLSLCGMSIEPIEFLTECVPTISAKEWGADSIGPKVGGALFRWQGALDDLDALAQRFWPVHLALHLQLTVMANETVKDKLCRQSFLRRRNFENFKMWKQCQDPLCLAGLENLRDIFEKKISDFLWISPSSLGIFGRPSFATPAPKPTRQPSSFSETSQAPYGLILEILSSHFVWQSLHVLSIY